MNDVFKRILALARRTGDRMIVTDPEGKEAFVLLNLDQYEELLAGSKGGDLELTPPFEADLEKGEHTESLSPESAKQPVEDKTEEFGEEQFYLEPVE